MEHELETGVCSGLYGLCVLLSSVTNGPSRVDVGVTLEV